MYRSLLCLLTLTAVLRTVDARAQIRDTVVMRDTLVPTWYPIEHKSVRAGVDVATNWGWYNSGAIPAPMALAGCDRYANGTSRGLQIDLITSVPFWGDLSPWSFGPTIGFRNWKGTFNWTQSSYISDGDTGIAPISIRHDLIPQQSVITIGGRFAWQSQGILLTGGAAIGYAFGQTYESSVHTDRPLLSGQTDAVTSSGDLSTKYRLLPSLTLSAGYEVLLAPKLYASPTIFANWMPIGVTSFWHGIEAGAGVTVFYDLTPRTERIPAYVHEQVPVHIQIGEPVKQSPLKASIYATAVDRNGQESEVVRMQIEEVRTRHAYPILNYIFFDEASSDLPKRYVQYSTPAEAQANFKGAETRENIKLLDLYHETLNILGSRLHSIPAATVTITGSTSNTGTEQGNIALAHRRAEVVAEYLKRVWQIDPKRIKIEATLLPKRPSPSTTPEGQEENRRVEIAISEPKGSAASVLDPIRVFNVEHLATPDQIQLHPTIETDTDIVSTYARISANGAELQSFRGAEAKKIWAPTEQMLSHLHDSLSIDFDVKDASGNEAHAHSAIPLSIIRVTSDREERVERWSLILFGFDEAKLGDRNEHQLDQIADMMSHMNVQRVLVQGYTDETGSTQHNDELSDQRAREVKQSLEQRLAKSQTTITAPILSEGRGSRDLPYDNRLPEGRFFSRTVNVTIERAPGK